MVCGCEWVFGKQWKQISESDSRPICTCCQREDTFLKRFHRSTTCMTWIWMNKSPCLYNELLWLCTPKIPEWDYSVTIDHQRMWPGCPLTRTWPWDTDSTFIIRTWVRLLCDDSIFIIRTWVRLLCDSWPSENVAWMSVNQNMTLGHWQYIYNPYLSETALWQLTIGECGLDVC